MISYRLTIEKFILKKGSEQFIADFYDHQAVFLLLPSCLTASAEVAVLPPSTGPQTWQDCMVHVGINDTRAFKPMAFDLSAAPSQALNLRFHLVQQLQDSFDQWGALEAHVKAPKSPSRSAPKLRSICLSEITFPIPWLEHPTTTRQSNACMELVFQIARERPPRSSRN